MENEEKRPTIDDFLTAHPTTIVSVRTSATPEKEGDQFNWLCTLTHEGRSITAEYHAGIGHALEPKRTINGRIGLRSHEKQKRNDGFWYVCGMYESNWRKCVVWPEPEARDLISCLALDASCIDNGETFIEFAREMGYESLAQYEEARKCYDGCHEALRDLRTLYGRQATEELMYETESL
jgi:hypothetical protein